MNVDHEPEPEPDLLSQAQPVAMLARYEEVSPMPVRPEYFGGAVHVPLSPPDFWHSETAMGLLLQLRAAGVAHVGTGNGYRFADPGGGTVALVGPDFYVLRRKPTVVDEAHYQRCPGWYAIELVAMVGEVASGDGWVESGPKLCVYAAAGVPVYVVIDRRSRTAHCHADPSEAPYGTHTMVDLGEPLPLPAPFLGD
ncbi:Uma2 family endonuclease [Streptomyces sp. S3(2020)]|uniref:Uma2 family endonuclease n=1 Tax=Streptomyces sp. S3(2020) TaxID=2732044 RepID=UPI0014894798|nr:Uma2 family endonuclease [Streptomyces sp. S3(2020)]NNN36848.1 Uma2 family endonuclease [Streptomyces sp. S3(2020)]